MWEVSSEVGMDVYDFNSFGGCKDEDLTSHS